MYSFCYSFTLRLEDLNFTVESFHVGDIWLASANTAIPFDQWICLSLIAFA